ncbi:MAG TPA: hypothetical protein VK901_07215 [Nitrospiraceae bacterium]|nr:hypothetical protein [Nitrospiraceae bacterium]
MGASLAHHSTVVLDCALVARLLIAAFEQALAEGHLPPGLVYHSDRRAQ